MLCAFKDKKLRRILPAKQRGPRNLNNYELNSREGVFDLNLHGCGHEKFFFTIPTQKNR